MRGQAEVQLGRSINQSVLQEDGVGIGLELNEGTRGVRQPVGERVGGVQDGKRFASHRGDRVGHGGGDGGGGDGGGFRRCRDQGVAVVRPQQPRAGQGQRAR